MITSSQFALSSMNRNLVLISRFLNCLEHCGMVSLLLHIDHKKPKSENENGAVPKGFV